jgi:hypothetical protein
VRDDLVASISRASHPADVDPRVSRAGARRRWLSDDARRQVDTAHRNSERLLGIVTDILSASSRSGSSIDTRLHLASST